MKAPVGQRIPDEPKSPIHYEVARCREEGQFRAVTALEGRVITVKQRTKGPSNDQESGQPATDEPASCSDTPDLLGENLPVRISSHGHRSEEHLDRSGNGCANA